jgi:hypothetical protein
VATNSKDNSGNQRKKQRDLLWQRRVYKDPSGYKEMKRMFSMLDQLLRVRPSHDFQNNRHWGSGAALSQQLCIVKARIGKTMEAHKKFISQYLPQENKPQVTEKPELFGDHDYKDPVTEYQNHMSPKHFKFIISPDSQQVDTEALVRTLVKRMEKATGFSFHWIAATHTDTGHNHAHLLINGTDRNGKDIYFDPSFIKGTMREMTREICTALVGRRTREEIEQRQKMAYKALRYTPIDDDLGKFERLYEGQNPRYESKVDTQEQLHHMRLMFLCSIGLAEQDNFNKNRFYLEKGWKGKLKTLGRYNSYLFARQDLMYTIPCNLEQYTAEDGLIEGEITKLYKMNDEDSWNHAIVIENKKTNKAWYVPLHYEPKNEFLGTQVRCRPRENERGQLRPYLQILSKSPQAAQHISK